MDDNEVADSDTGEDEDEEDEVALFGAGAEDFCDAGAEDADVFEVGGSDAGALVSPVCHTVLCACLARPSLRLAF